jgi:HSP20 family protein
MTTTTRNRLSNVLPAQLSREFGELFDTFMNGGGALRTRPAWHAPASVWEENDRFHIELDLPGVAQGDLELTFEKGSLAITAERKAPEGERMNWHDERGYGRITRLIGLPDSADTENIQAELANGVLYVSVPKKPDAQPRQIEVRVA